jgi:hypothetical protein
VETSLSTESQLANPIDFKESPIFPVGKQWVEIDPKLLPDGGNELIYYGDRPTHWGIPDSVTPDQIRAAITIRSTGSGQMPKPKQTL